MTSSDAYRTSGEKWPYGKSPLLDWTANDMLYPEEGRPLLSRRELLAAGSVGGMALLLDACAASHHEVIRKAGQPTSTKPATTTSAPACTSDKHSLSDIDHVVIVMQENRSFDCYFGSYPGVNGFSHHPIGSDGVFAQPDPFNKTSAPIGDMLPWHMHAKLGTAECTTDLTHSWAPQHHCWNGGRMDGFVRTHAKNYTTAEPWGEGIPNGYLTMAYFDRSDLPFHYALADAFTICDGYHCAVLGPTDPNRLMAISGTIDPAGKHGGPVITTPLFDSSSFMYKMSWTTMPEQLSANGISWKIYNQDNIGNPATAAYLATNNVLSYFKQYQDPSTELHKLAFGSTWPKDFVDDVKSGNLPQVSWVLAPLGYDEHPPSPPAQGGVFLSQVLRTLVSKPEIWSKTVMFVNYDENDGDFDHVSPPVPAAGTSGEWLTVSTLPKDAYGIRGPVGLGMRVPMLVISPYSTGGYIDSNTYDHTSMLRFIETRWGVEVPNLSAWRRSVTGDLAPSLGMAAKPVTVLPATLTAPHPNPAAEVARECLPGDATAKAISGKPIYPPAHQSMPTQEPGTKKKRPIC
ncbi:MAG: phospholipase C [Acidimicrobiales bacterium]